MHGPRQWLGIAEVRSLERNKIKPNAANPPKVAPPQRVFGGKHGPQPHATGELSLYFW
ncbi:hypothetical protein [Xanthomonas phage RTH11]|nr:hypothetical protein [Xanthomonas phage RTH11]